MSTSSKSKWRRSTSSASRTEFPARPASPIRATRSTPEAFPILKKAGIRFARRGGSPEYKYRDGRGFAYEPGLDHPLLVPSAGDARPDWTLDDFIAAAEQARHGRIAVLQFHGVPDTAHAWVSTSVQQFDAYMNYLAKNGYTVIAMRDLAKYVDADVMPSNPQTIIDDRKQSIEQRASRDNFRRPQSDDELRFWLKNMFVDHGFTEFEASAATGLSTDEIAAAVERFSLRKRGDARGSPAIAQPRDGAKGAAVPWRTSSAHRVSRWGHSAAAGNEVQRVLAVGFDVSMSSSIFPRRSG